MVFLDSIIIFSLAVILILPRSVFSPLETNSISVPSSLILPLLALITILPCSASIMQLSSASFSAAFSIQGYLPHLTWNAPVLVEVVHPLLWPSLSRENWCNPSLALSITAAVTSEDLWIWPIVTDPWSLPHPIAV